jgi:hypothetical protein
VSESDTEREEMKEALIIAICTIQTIGYFCLTGSLKRVFKKLAGDKQEKEGEKK